MVSVPWPESFEQYGICVKELFAVLAAIYTWGHHWHNKQIFLFSDNTTVCNIWSKTSTKEPDLLFFLRHLYLFAATRNINIWVKHIPGRLNTLADLLSRLQVAAFLKLHPTADQTPTQVNTDIWHLSNNI